MNIPRFWAEANEEVETPDRGRLPLRCWGWSNTELAEAKERARHALIRLADRVRHGAPFPDRYAYGSRALREEIIREIQNSSGEPAGVITRNGYGSLVLNTSQVMFVDVDIQRPAKSGWFQKKADPAEAAFSDLRQRLGGLSGNYRIYKTAAGFRVLATDRCYDPVSSEAEGIMKSIQADPNFMQLCRAQKSFRARLTPKPWRCGSHVPPSQFPRVTPSHQAAFQKWLTSYETAAKKFSTCIRLEDIGSGRVHDEVANIVTWHDELARCDSGLALA